MRTQKRSIKVFVIASLVLAVFGFARFAHAEAEVIRDFDVQITIQSDGVALVKETIQYDFGSNQKHGIFRNIPLTAKDGPRLNINVLGVNDEFIKNYKYTTSTSNDVLQIKIGDPNVLISGFKTYVISYQVKNVIRGFGDHDELYWNVTGNEWSVAIEKVFASVRLPSQSISGLTMDCFTGSQGSTEKNCTFGQNLEYANYSTSQVLRFGEGLTIVLGIPPGYITVPPYVPDSGRSSNSRGDIFSYLSPLLAFALILLRLFLIARKVKGRVKKPKPKIPRELKSQPVVVEYNPPEDLPPIETGTLLDRQVDPTDVFSVILDLAVRGYLKIRYTVKEIKFWPDKKDFELVKLKDGADLVHPADKIMFELLFGTEQGINRSIRISDLAQSGQLFHKTLQKIEEETEQHLRDEGYFDPIAKARSKKLGVCSSIAFILALVGFFGSAATGGSLSDALLIVGGIGGIALAILLVVIASLSRKLSVKGISTMAKILGFREFLQLTEKDKIDLLSAPELYPEVFEKFLPYAMVLGVEEKWAKKFEGIYNTVPTWYEDPTHSTFSSVLFMQSMNSFSSSLNQTFGVGTSSSGLGGGGSSGGGSGGGGGGSW